MTFTEAVKLLGKDFRRWGKRAIDNVFLCTKKYGVIFTAYSMEGKIG